MRPHISYSELASYARECQWRWKLDYLEDRRSKIYSVHFDFGTAIHEALEKHYTRNNPITVDEAVELFKSKFSELTTENGKNYSKPLSVKDYTSLLAGGENIIRRFDECEELKNAEVVHNEFPLFEDIDLHSDDKMKFKGFIDVIIKGKDKRGKTVLWICDFKTCSWGWDRDTRSDAWKHHQLFLYKYFICKKFDIDPKQVRTAFVLLKKRPPKESSPIEFFPVSAGPISVQRSLDVLSGNILHMIENEKNDSFKKDRSFCTSKYGEKCPYLDTTFCTKDT